MEVIQLLLAETDKYCSPVMEHGFLKQREMAKILAVVYVHCQDNMQI
jgi:hypothetical protein